MDAEKEAENKGEVREYKQKSTEQKHSIQNKEKKRTVKD